MIRRTFPLALALVVGVFGCGASADAEDAADSTSGTTANLLDSRVTDAVGRPTVPTTGQQSQAGAPPSALAAPRQEIDISQLGFNAGDTAAPVRVIEFSDFGCSYCRQFHLEIYHSLEEQYMNTGKVEWKYVPIIIGMFPNAIEAAVVGECAGEQGHWPTMRDRIFEAQSEWKNADDPWPTLNRLAEEEGLDIPMYESCIAEERRMDRIAAGSQLAGELGVRGTPTFFIVGYQPIPGMIPQELFEQVLDTVYAEAIRTQGTGG